MSRRVKQLYEFGPFRLDPVEHTLLRDGRPIPLQAEGVRYAAGFYLTPGV